jgi:hypothetical protein
MAQNDRFLMSNSTDFEAELMRAAASIVLKTIVIFTQKPWGSFHLYPRCLSALTKPDPKKRNGGRASSLVVNS